MAAFYSYGELKALDRIKREIERAEVLKAAPAATQPQMQAGAAASS